MKLSNKFNWLWALLLTASLFFSCATVPISSVSKVIPALDCEHIVQLTSEWLYDHTQDMLEGTETLETNYVILGWTCEGYDTALIDIGASFVYYQDLPERDQITVCARVLLSLKSTLSLDDKLYIDYTRMEIKELKQCER